MADVFDNMSNCRRIVEDILIFSRTYEEHFNLVNDTFSRDVDNRISLNIAKIQFARPSVKFGGFIVESSGFRPDLELTKAISAFPSPQNVTDLRSFFGLCQQVGNFLSQIAAALSAFSTAKERHSIGMIGGKPNQL